jgi:DNA-binding transcriptional regulator YdaS (Cro superfamily)
MSNKVKDAAAANLLEELHDLLDATMATTHREEGVRLAIEKAGGVNALARELGMTGAALSVWRRVPAHRILQVEAVTGIPREKLRPDLYRVRRKHEPRAECKGGSNHEQKT